MVATTAIKLAIFSESDRPHHRGFQDLLPPDVQLEYLGQVAPETAAGSPAMVEAARAAEQAGLKGLLVTGAPREVASPGLQDELRAAVRIPVTTALHAGAAALRAFGARRALVLTPFDEPIRNGIRDNLARRQIDATVPPVVAGGPTEAAGLPPEVVYRLATDAWKPSDGFDALYFQGAVLDPLPIIEPLEGELGKPIVASNPAMLGWNRRPLAEEPAVALDVVSAAELAEDVPHAIEGRNWATRAPHRFRGVSRGRHRSARYPARVPPAGRGRGVACPGWSPVRTWPLSPGASHQCLWRRARVLSMAADSSRAVPRSRRPPVGCERRGKR